MEAPNNTHQEAPSEALRVARIRAQTGELSSDVPRLSKEQSLKLEGSALRSTFDAVLMGRHADHGLEALRASGILEAVLPEVAKLAGLGDYKERHKDVWEHTKQVVVQTVPQLHLRWAALLHDIGKAKTRGLTDKGKVHFHGHPEVGARMFKRMVHRKRWFLQDRRLEDQVHFLILHHQRTAHYDKSWTDSAVRRFARDLGPQLDDIFALARADMTTKRKEKKRRMLREMKEFRVRIERLAEEDAAVPPLPKGLGTEIIDEFGLPPSKLIGDLMKHLERVVAEGKLPPQQEPQVYINFLKENAAELGLQNPE